MFDREASLMLAKSLLSNLKYREISFIEHPYNNVPYIEIIVRGARKLNKRNLGAIKRFKPKGAYYIDVKVKFPYVPITIQHIKVK